MAKFSELPFYVIKEYFLHKNIDNSSYYLPVYGDIITSPTSGTESILLSAANWISEGTTATTISGSCIELQYTEGYVYQQISIENSTNSIFSFNIDIRTPGATGSEVSVSILNYAKTEILSTLKITPNNSWIGYCLNARSIDNGFTIKLEKTIGLSGKVWFENPIIRPLKKSCESLRGKTTGISTLGGYGTDFYIKTSNNYYRLKGLYRVSSEDTNTSKFYSRESIDDSYLNEGKLNKFIFEFIAPSAEAYNPSEFTIDQLFPFNPDNNYSGSEVYFRRGSPIYDFIKMKGYDSFININKPFIYFGKLYKGEIENTIEIQSHHLKDYIYSMLPSLNRSDNYDEYLGVAFDQIYQNTYNRLKYLQCIPDAYEIDDNYLSYIRETFNVPQLTTGQGCRTYLKYIVSLLKRKGTYTYIYGIWKLLNKSNNTLNIYERWHVPLSSGECPYPYFEDHLYTKNRLYYDDLLTYNPVPSGGAGYRYYRTTYPCNVYGGTFYGIDVPYPVYGLTDYDYNSTIFCTLSAATMSFDFDSFTQWLMTHDMKTPFIMGEMWVSAGGDLTKGVPEENYPYTDNIVAFDLAGESVSGKGNLVVPDFIHSHPNFEKTWTILHTLGVPSSTQLTSGQYVNDIYPLVIVTDRQHRQIIPDKIIRYDDDTIIIDFDGHKVNGYVMLKRPDYELIQNSITETWNATHNLGDAILAQVYNSDPVTASIIQPEDIYSIENKATVTFPVSTSGRLVLSDVITKPHQWNFTHHLNIDEEYVMLQMMDANLYNFWPNQETSDSVFCSQAKNTSPSGCIIYFNDWQAGYAMAASGDYYHTQVIPATAWNIEHNLVDNFPVVDILNESYDHLPPSAYSIESIDSNNLIITFPTSAYGYAIIGKPDEVILVSEPASASWFIRHNLFTDFNLVTLYNGDTNISIVPTSIRRYKWINNMEFEFGSDYFGYVSLKSATSAAEYLQRVHNLGKEMSTHVKIEMDITNEPIEIDGIIYKNRLDKLIELWEYMRPVSRVYHYGMVISPLLDFTGNTSILYPYNSDIQFSTKYIGDPIYKITGCYVKAVSSPTLNVSVFHQLGSTDIIVQCFDDNRNMVIPLDAYPQGPNTAKILFSQNFTGNIIISEANSIYMDSYSTSAAPSGFAQPGIDMYVWDVSASPLGEAYMNFIPQITDIDGVRVLADEINTQDIPDYPLVWFNPSSSIFESGHWAPSAGYFVSTSGSKFDFTLNTGTSTAYIDHYMNGETFQIAVYDNNNKLIYPENINVTNKDRITLTFETTTTGVSGYAIIKKTSNVGYGQNYTFNHVKIGYGTTGKLYSPLATNNLEHAYPETYTITDNDIDQDPLYYYITVNINENIDYSYNPNDDKYGIREIGVYDGNNNLIFYSYCSLIEKPEGVSLKVYYRIRKQI